jgi:hypothetical protein
MKIFRFGVAPSGLRPSFSCARVLQMLAKVFSSVFPTKSGPLPQDTMIQSHHLAPLYLQNTCISVFMALVLVSRLLTSTIMWPVHARLLITHCYLYRKGYSPRVCMHPGRQPCKHISYKNAQHCGKLQAATQRHLDASATAGCSSLRFCPMEWLW